MAYSLGETEKATWADIALEYKILYNFTVTGLKPVVFLGKALDDLAGKRYRALVEELET